MFRVDSESGARDPEVKMVASCGASMGWMRGEVDKIRGTDNFLDRLRGCLDDRKKERKMDAF